MKKEISFSEFLEISEKLEIKIGEVVDAQRIPKKDKLITLIVSFSDDEKDNKIVVTNLGEFFNEEHFLNKKFPFITNLAPSKIGGVVSQAMIMVASKNNVTIDGVITNIDLCDYTKGSNLL